MFLHESAQSSLEPACVVPAAAGRLASDALVAGGDIPDLRLVMPEAQAGDETAIRALHAITQSIIDSRLRRYPAVGQDEDGVRGAVAEKVLAADFDPHWPLPQDTPPERERQIILGRYSAYIRKTMRSVMADAIQPSTPTDPHVLAETATAGFVSPEEPVTYENGDATAALPDELVKPLLSERQFQIFDLCRSGMGYAEIGEQVNITVPLVKKEMRGAIAQLEQHILGPGGLYRAVTVAETANIDPHLVGEALRTGKIQGVKILHRWYVKPEWVKTVEPPADAIPLAAVASGATCLTITRRFPERLIRYNGRMYVRAQDMGLVEELNMQKEQARAKVKPPEPGYALVVDIARTASEAHRLRKALGKGEFSRVISQRRLQFVPEAEAAAMLQQFRGED